MARNKTYNDNGQTLKFKKTSFKEADLSNYRSGLLVQAIKTLGQELFNEGINESAQAYIREKILGEIKGRMGYVQKHWQHLHGWACSRPADRCQQEEY